MTGLFHRLINPCYVFHDSGVVWGFWLSKRLRAPPQLPSQLDRHESTRPSAVKILVAKFGATINSIEARVNGTCRLTGTGQVKKGSLHPVAGL